MRLLIDWIYNDNNYAYAHVYNCTGCISTGINVCVYVSVGVCVCVCLLLVSGLL